MELKFLTLISQEEVNYQVLLKERMGLKKVRWYHTMFFIKSFNKLTKEIEVLRKLDPKTIEESEDCPIKRPENIDSISYGAMVELQILLQNPSSKEIGELIIDQISISCYESHTKKEFDSDSEDFQAFKTLVSNQDLVKMLGLHNWIDKQYGECVEKWNSLFKNVQVHDQDWDNAGGAMMDKFNVLNSIRKSCSAFNLDYYKALQLPYGLVQASSLSDATQNFIREKMRVSIEARMKAKQNQ